MGGFNRNILAKGLLDIGKNYSDAVIDEGQEKRRTAERIEDRVWQAGERDKRDAMEWARKMSGRYTADGRELTNKEVDALPTEEQGGLLSGIQVQDTFQQNRENEKQKREDAEIDQRYGDVTGGLITKGDAKNLAENQLPMTDFDQQNKDRDYKLRKAEAERKGKDDGKDTKITVDERKVFNNTLDRMLFSAYQAEKQPADTSKFFQEDPSGEVTVNVTRVLADASPTLRKRYQEALLRGEELLPQSSDKPGSVAMYAWQESEVKKPSQQGLLGKSVSKDEVAKLPEKKSDKTVVRTGRDKSGRRVVQYSDGSVDYAD